MAAVIRRHAKTGKIINIIACVDRNLVKKLLHLKEEMGFQLCWDGACGMDKVLTYAPLGVDGFVLGTTILFGKGRPYIDILKELRARLGNGVY